MRKGKHDKKLKCNWTQAMSRVQVGGELFKTEQNISQSVKRFFFFFLKLHCAAECSFSASLTKWQSDATLWMKLCLISSQTKTSQIHTRGEAKQTKLKK